MLEFRTFQRGVQGRGVEPRCVRVRFDVEVVVVSCRYTCEYDVCNHLPIDEVAVLYRWL
jgi:hypothetical protein